MEAVETTAKTPSRRKRAAVDASQHSVADVSDMLVVEHRRRNDYLCEERSLTLRIKAICRRSVGGDLALADEMYDNLGENGDPHILALVEARAMIAHCRKTYEKNMKALASSLPVWQWADPINGFGELGLAQIVGEAGDLSKYANPAKLWKRMGLAVMHGERQRRIAGTTQALKDLAVEHGYNPRRRSVIHVIGDSMIKKQSPYREVYLARKEYERERAQERGQTVCPAAKIPAKGKELYMSDGHVHNRALRYMEKRLLRDLWSAWRVAR